jgi:hypothetical protein
MSNNFPTKEALLKEISETWDALNTRLGSLSENQLTNLKDAQGWSIKDHLTHLTAWERGSVFFLQGLPRHEGLGVERSLYLTDFEEEVNAAIQQAHQDQSLSAALDESRETHQELLRLLNSLNEADLRKPYHYYLPDEPGGEANRLAIDVVYNNSANHYREHMPWIEAIARQEKG